MISLNYWQRNGLPKNAYIHLKWLSLRSEVNSKRKAVISCDDNVEKFIQNPILIKCIDGKERAVSTLRARQFYQILSNNQVTYPTKSTKLMEDFELDKEMLRTFYILPYMVTKDLKLREFQYKVLNFLINTNVLLQK